MKNYLFLSFLFLLGFSACDGTLQYNVFVKNTTDQTIKVTFKSPTDVANVEEQTLELKPMEQKQIIRTKNITIEGTSSTSAEHCTQVAEYVKAFKNETPSTLTWCDQKIKFEKEDIQQASFTIEYTNADF